MSGGRIRHAFQSAKSDGEDTTVVRPSNWNEDHDLIAGWQNVAFPINYAAAAAFTTAAALAINGGTLAVPIFVPGEMAVDYYIVRCTDTSGAHTAEGALYLQSTQTGSAAENSLDRIPGTDAAWSFTPSAASSRAATISGAPVAIGPGVYWFVIRNTSGSVVFNLGSTASSAAFAPATAQTKTIGSSLGATLDFVAATWSKTSSIYGVAVVGRVFGQTTPF